jgi:hypothetical protein
MENDALSNFIHNVQHAYGPLTTQLVAHVHAQITQLTAAPPTQPWLQALHSEAPASQELHRDKTHGFVLLAHTEPQDLYRAPHDHGRGWVIYALQRGELEIGTYARVQDAQGRVRLVRRDVSLLRAGEARVYLPGDIHDTRCVNGPALLFRFTDRDLKHEDQVAHKLTRYTNQGGVWTTGLTS